MRTIALLTLMTSLSALACPELSGKYANCRSTTDQYTEATNLEVTQTLTNEITTYSLISRDDETQEETTEVVKANGKTTSTTVTDTDSGTTVKTYITGSCTSSAFSMRVAIYMDNEQVANVTTRYTKVGKQLHQQLTGTAMGEAVNDKIICE